MLMIISKCSVHGVTVVATILITSRKPMFVNFFVEESSFTLLTLLLRNGKFQFKMSFYHSIYNNILRFEVSQTMFKTNVCKSNLTS